MPFGIQARVSLASKVAGWGNGSSWWVARISKPRETPPLEPLCRKAEGEPQGSTSNTVYQKKYNPS
jgi:hypothetical protein